MDNPDQVVLKAQRKVELLHSPINSPDFQLLEKQHFDLKKIASESGRKDGSSGYPKYEDTANPFEDQIIAWYNQLLHVLNADASSLVSQLTTRCTNLAKKFESTVLGQLSRKEREINKIFTDAKVKFQRPLGKTNAWPVFLKLSNFFLALFLLCSLSEYPLNAEALKALKFNATSTKILAFPLTIFFAFLSHTLGKFQKRKNETQLNLVLRNLILTLLLGYLVALSLFRASYSLATDEFATLNNRFEQGSASDIMHSLPFLDIVGTYDFWMSIVLVSLLLIVGVTLGYLSHDSSSEFESAFKAYHYKRPIILKQYSDLLEKEKRTAAISSQPSEILSLLNDIDHVKELISTLSTHQSKFSNFADALCRETIFLYRAENARARNTNYPDPIHWSFSSGRYIELLEPIEYDQTFST